MPVDPRFTPQWDKPIVENEQTMFRGVLKRIVLSTGNLIHNFTFNPESGILSIEMRLDLEGALKAIAKLSTYITSLPKDYPNYDGMVKMIKEERQIYKSYINTIRKQQRKLKKEEINVN